jgi:nucleotide-binding universal stress UspA family protein
MFDRIIVPIEEGDGADALDYPGRMARALRCELVLVHVHRPREAPAELEGLPQYRYQHVVESWDSHDADAEAREVEWLADLVDLVGAAEPELKVSGRVIPAPLSRCVHQEWERERVLAMLQAPDPGEEAMGATAHELIRACRVPVLLHRPGMDLLPIRRILVGLDGSTFSEEALTPAIELARALGARLMLVEVVTQHSGLSRLLHPAERTTEAAESALRAVRERIPPEAGLVEIGVVEHESPAGGLLQQASQTGADLIAMATHGRGGLRRLLFGSVAERVVRDSAVPVLVYRPEGSGVGAWDGRTRVASAI